MIGTGIDVLSIATAGVTAKPIRVIDGTDHLLTADDANYMLHFTNDLGVKLSIPAGLPNEIRFEGKQIGAGSIAFDPVDGSGVEIFTSLGETIGTAEVYSAFTLDFIAADKYVLKVQDSDPTKPNKAANTEYETLTDTSDIYRLLMATRLGGLIKTALFWNETTKELAVPGSQAIWKPSSEVTSGNMGIEAVIAALESFKVFDNKGNFFSTGTENIGTAFEERVFRIFAEQRLYNGISFSATEYKAVECEAATALKELKSIEIPLNSVVTVDIKNIAVMDIDKNLITGEAQFTFINNAGVVTVVPADALKYDEQYSTIKAVDGYVTNVDARIDVSVAGNVGYVNFVNVAGKLTNVHCEIKYNTTLIPVV